MLREADEKAYLKAADGALADMFVLLIGSAMRPEEANRAVGNDKLKQRHRRNDSLVAWKDDQRKTRVAVESSRSRNAGAALERTRLSEIRIHLSSRDQI